ncbi:MAG: Stp1/IreP family PP2C-type Ser/Thr phosphatase [Candidatus Binataceae bacterium]
MLICPQCGQQAPDDTKFCERCGQGLDASGSKSSAQALIPLEPGTHVKDFEIIELINQSSQENRYRVSRDESGNKIIYQLRERLGPKPAADEVEEEPSAAHNGSKSGDDSTQAEDPGGPHAKTAELEPLAIDGDEQMAEHPGAAANPLSEEAASAEPGTELVLTDEIAVDDEPASGVRKEPADPESPEPHAPQDLGDVFGRVLALSLTLKHPAFQCAIDGFANSGRVYLVYRDETITPLKRRRGGIRIAEAEALGVAIQLCQAVSFLHRRALRLNDICPDSVGFGPDGRVKVTGLDYVSNDNELQAEPIFNDGYTAPEIYRAKKVDKRADIFSIGAMLYTCLTAERLESESWREEAGSVAFYPPHVVSPQLEQAVRRCLVFTPDGRWPNIDALKSDLLKLFAMIRIRSGVLTDVGMVRELNEDVVMAQEYLRDSQVEPASSFLYVVCDGMGGAAAGEIAAAIAVSTIRNYVESRLSTAAGDSGELLRSALEEANSKIIEYQAAHEESRGMGSTGVCALVTPPLAAVAWVGDSRAYMLENGASRQLTKDHSLVQRLIEIGQITLEEARHHEHKNVITRSLGARQSGPAGAESVSFRLRRGDRLMLCSDGLIAHVEDNQIGEILRRHSDPYESARELVVAANAGGGTDNISVIVVFAD